MIADLINQYGYFIILLINFTEMIFIVGHFVPGGNTFLVLIGFLSTITHINIFVCAILAFAGTIAGSHISYIIGKKGGKKFIDRDTMFYSQESFEKFQSFFNKHSIKAMLLGRPIALFRQFHAATAGVTGISERNFIKYNLLGGFLWVIICLSIGWLIGIFLKDKVSYNQVRDAVDKIVIIFTALSVLGIGIGIFYKKYIKSKSKKVLENKKRRNLLP